MTDEPHTGALIVLLPVASDPINEISQEDQAHITTLWFGDMRTLDEGTISGIREAVRLCAEHYSEFTAKVNGRAVLGDEDAGVLLVESYELMEIRNALAADEYVQDGYRNAERQFPAFIPHVTLTYGGGLPAESDQLPVSIRFGAIGLWLGGQHEAFPLLPEAIEEPAPEREGFNASGMIYPIDCPDDLPVAVQFATEHPDGRWYVEKCARAFGVDCIPESWSVPA